MRNRREHLSFELVQKRAGRGLKLSQHSGKCSSERRNHSLSFFLSLFLPFFLSLSLLLPSKPVSFPLVGPSLKSLLPIFPSSQALFPSHSQLSSLSLSLSISSLITLSSRERERGRERENFSCWV